METTTGLVLVYDLHATDGSLIAPVGTAVEIINPTEEEGRQAVKNNRRTFKRFDDPDKMYEIIRLVGGQTLYAVHSAHIG